jgi:hypothetical protein
MVDKINGKAAEGEFLGKQLDFYSVAFTADLNVTAANGYATGALTLTGVTTAAETIVINGVTITVVASDATGNQINAGSADDSAAALRTLLNGNTAFGVTAAGTAGVVELTARAYGVAGNAVTTTETLVNGSFGGATLTGGADELGRAAAANKRRERIIETISLNGQPIIIGAFSNSTDGAQTLKFAIEHSGSWQDSETVLVADKASASLDASLEAIAGVTDVTVTKTRAL